MNTCILDKSNIIGKGKTGIVYSTNKKNVVVKAIPIKKFDNIEYIIAKKIGKLGIGPVIYKKQTCKKKKLVLIYMQRIDTTLLKWVTKKRTKKEYNEVYSKLIKLIKKLHKNNIIHGDIHLGNIGLIGKKWVLIDFDKSHRTNKPNKVKKSYKTNIGLKLFKLPSRNNNSGYEEYLKRMLVPYKNLSVLNKMHFRYL